MVSLKCLYEDAKGILDLIIMTDSGIIIKLPLDQVSTLRRATQGVRLINLKDNQIVSTVALVEKEDSVESNELETETVDKTNSDSNIESE